jgi:hypothetical protein
VKGLLIVISCAGFAVPFFAGAADEEILGLENFGGSDEALAMLLAQGFVVTDETYRQICSFYIHRRPAFITTDALLYAYFVNVEQALLRLEEKQAADLPALVRKLRSGLAVVAGNAEANAFEEVGLGILMFEGDSLRGLVEKGRFDKAWLDAAAALDDYLVVVEVLAKGATAPEQLGEVPPEVAAEVELILAADRTAKSPLRGLRLDYLRFEPRGFYRQSAELEAYYRAVTWLHEVPFRLDDEEETRQAVILTMAMDICHLYYWERYFPPYHEFLGPSDDLSIRDYIRTVRTDPELGALWGLGDFESDTSIWPKLWYALRKLPGPRHTTIPTVRAVKDPDLYRGLRLFPRPTLFDNYVFGPLTPFGKWRPPVSGEELMAVLGSEAAREIVMNREAKDISGYTDLMREAEAAAAEAEKEIAAYFTQNRGLFRAYDKNMPRRYLELYRSLCEAPTDPSLPAYYRHSAWRYKDLNTCLAGWAHHRYIWDAHGKRRMCYLGVTDWPPGVAEPNERFVDALLELTIYTDGYFKRHGVEHPLFNDLAALLVEVRSIQKKQLAREPLTDDQRQFFATFGFELAHCCGLEENSALVDERLPDTPFCVPISLDLFTGAERVVGQLRPRAIYVICEEAGQTYLAVGGVLTYADHVGPVEGPGRITLEAWRAKAARGELAPPAWQAKFAVGTSEERMLGDLRRGKIYEPMMYNPCEEMGDILAEKLTRGDEFEWVNRPDDWHEYNGRDAAVVLFGLTRHPDVVEVLFPQLEDPVFDHLPVVCPGWPNAGAVRYGGRRGDDFVPGNFRGWPEAVALEGKLADEHADAMMKWIDEGHPYPNLLLGLMATIPTTHCLQLLLAYLDNEKPEREIPFYMSAPFEDSGRKDWDFGLEMLAYGTVFYAEDPWNAALFSLLARPGVEASRELAGRLSLYEGAARINVASGLYARWRYHNVNPYAVEAKSQYLAEDDRRFVIVLGGQLKKVMEECKRAEGK